MTAPIPKFSLLMNLAKETSSEKRRELLHLITDMFISQPDKASCAALDELAVAILADVSSEVRSDLARTFMKSALPLRHTAHFLAAGDIDVARPVIEGWASLSDGDLLEIVATKSQDHLMAVSKRRDIGEPISDALVNHGEDRVVASLLANVSAKIGRNTFEKVSVRAILNKDLNGPMALRHDIPLEVMSMLYSSLSPDFRKAILRRYENIAPEVLDAALERSWIQVEKLYGAVPRDFGDAQEKLRRLESIGELKPALLGDLALQGAASTSLFALAFAKLTGESYNLVAGLMKAHDLDAFALLCRGAGFSRSLFTKILHLLVDEVRHPGIIGNCAEIYDKVPVESAQRAIRFWKLRVLM